MSESLSDFRNFVQAPRLNLLSISQHNVKNPRVIIEDDQIAQSSLAR